MTLIFSISCSIAVSVLLKLAPRYRLHIPQIVTINYIVASLLCIVLLQPHPAQLLEPAASWLILLALGLLLPSIFIVMASAVRHAGIVRSDAAQRLSLLIPLIAAFAIFKEPLSLGKGSGVVIALTALVLLLVRRSAGAKAETPQASGARPETTHGVLTSALLLLGVWAGYGVIDILFKQLAREALDFSSSLLVAFVLSGVIMLLWSAMQRQRWHRHNLLGGALLGLLNFGNIYFYIRAHQAFPANPALVFSAMNIGVIAGGILIGAGLFKERLNRWNVLGLILAVCAIFLLVPA